jgi:hypothetical protein
MLDGPQVRGYSLRMLDGRLNGLALSGLLLLAGLLLRPARTH